MQLFYGFLHRGEKFGCGLHEHGIFRAAANFAFPAVAAFHGEHIGARYQPVFQKVFGYGAGFVPVFHGGIAENFGHKVFLCFWTGLLYHGFVVLKSKRYGMGKYTKIQNIMQDVKNGVPVDLRIDNAQIADVFGGEFFSGSLCVHQGIIAGYSPDMPARNVIDAQNAYLLPTFFDAHVHIESSMLSPEKFAELVIPFGTGTVIADPHEIANVKGLDGIRYMLESAGQSLLDVKIMLPSCVPALPFEDAGAVLSARDLEELIREENVFGLGEMMNVPGVLMQDENVLEKLALAYNAGKMTDGHAPLTAGADLDMYALAGVRSDHECTTPEEAADRIRRGMYVLLREGSAAHDLVNLLPAVNSRTIQNCMFCTDDKQCADIMRRGHINNSVRLAVENGVDPIDAVRMATINTARAYGIKEKGALVPGMEASFMLVEDIRECMPRAVYIKGSLAAENGRFVAAVKKEYNAKLEQLSHSVQDSMQTLLPEHLDLAVPSGKARVIRVLPHSLLTSCEVMDIETDENGNFDFSRNKGLLKLAVAERHKKTGKLGLGLLHGEYGLQNGAIATSISHDSHNIVAAGDNDADILFAMREVEKMGGGIAMVSGKKVLAGLALPIGGLMSKDSPENVAKALDVLYETAKNHYRIWDKADAFMTLSFLALPVIPDLKLTPQGLFNVTKFAFTDIDAAKA